MSPITLTLDPQGRLTVPKSLRTDLGLEAGDEFVAYEDDGELVIETRTAALKRLRRVFAPALEGYSVDQFLAEKRDEAEREWQRWEPR